MCTPMFIAALFIIARTWKQPRCTSTDKWVRKLSYIYTIESYSAIKKNAFESVLMKWMKLEPIIQSEVRQKDKDHYNVLEILMLMCLPLVTNDVEHLLMCLFAINISSFIFLVNCLFGFLLHL